jgi:hypothetical protein
LTPDVSSSPAADKLAEICERLLAAERSAVQNALLTNAVAALGATGDERLVPLTQRLIDTSGAIYCRQVRARLLEVVERLRHEFPAADLQRLEAALQSLTEASNGGERNRS